MSAATDLDEGREAPRPTAENLAETFFLMDADLGETLYVSPGYEAYWGRSCDSMYVAPLSFLDAVASADRPRLMAHIASALGGHETEEIDFRVIRPDGTIRWQRARAFPVHGEDGEVHRVAAVSLDITARREAEKALRENERRTQSERAKLEEQLRQSQKMEAVGRLAGGIAHDFNNLLTVINGFSSVLLETLEDPEHRELVEQVREAGQRGALLTRQLLAFSRKQVLEPRVLDLNAVVRDMGILLGRLLGEDIDLTTSLDPHLPSLTADPAQLQQVLLNLAINARDAMPSGGKLTIETAAVRLPEHYARTHADVSAGDYILLSVTDAGTGMSGEELTRIFEPFFTTKEKGKGTGLGLAMVHGFVKQSGGHVQVYSEPGVGTTFKVYLPVSDLQAPAAIREQVRSVPVGSETILVAEDEASVRALVERVLTGRGYRVLSGRDGDEALALAAADPGSIDLLVTDVVMPGMGGRDLVERLRAQRSDLRVLYLSGYTDDAVVRHGILEEREWFLQKPFGPHDLAHKVRRVLDAPAAAPVSRAGP